MIVYHYTPIDTFEKILSTYSKETGTIELRATHCNFLNDGTESILGARLLPKYITQIEEDLEVEENWKLSSAFNNKQYLHTIISHIKSFNDIEERLSKFVVSFSKAFDNLVMWSMYGNKGDGIALGFDSEILTNSFSEPMRFHEEECFYLTEDEIIAPCDKTSEIYQFTKELYKGMTHPQVKKTIYEFFTSKDLEEQERWNTVMNMLVINLITHVSMFCKLDMWKNEQEFRLIVDDVTMHVLYQKSRNNVYVPYVNVPILLKALKEIVIGPTCGRNAHGMINSLLYQKGLNPNNISIKHSNCPLQ